MAFQVMLMALWSFWPRGPMAFQVIVGNGFQVILANGPDGHPGDAEGLLVSEAPFPETSLVLL